MWDLLTAYLGKEGEYPLSASSGCLTATKCSGNCLTTTVPTAPRQLRIGLTLPHLQNRNNQILLQCRHVMWSKFFLFVFWFYYFLKIRRIISGLIWMKHDTSRQKKIYYFHFPKNKNKKQINLPIILASLLHWVSRIEINMLLNDIKGKCVAEQLLLGHYSSAIPPYHPPP